jgi:hypothetical protein
MAIAAMSPRLLGAAKIGSTIGITRCLSGGTNWRAKSKIDTVTKYMGPTGKYADGYEMYNPTSYYKEFMQAYGMWYDLIANNSANSMASSYSATLASAQANFVNGKSAMIPYAQWAKYELSAIAEAERFRSTSR